MCKRTKFSFLTSAIWLLCASILAPFVNSQTLERLPPTDAIAQLDRLPNPDEGPTVNAPLLDPRSVTRFAGGRIELQAPRGWWVGEVSFGREVRLIIAPQRLPNVRKMPNDGMWIAYHAVTHSESRDEKALSHELAARLRLAMGSKGQHAQPTSFEFKQWPAAVAEFTSGNPASSGTAITGRHVLVRTEWGILEFHASAPDEIVESRSDAWTETWESLRLNPPAIANSSSRQLSAEPNSIIGDWKAYRSRMRFREDGRVVLTPDTVDNNNPSSPLTGTFESRDDLIFVRWDDGSRLNFRWRVKGSDLFLTDHEGQISHLKRVLN